MKTTIFLVLLSLSFAFIPENLYNRANLTAADVMAGSAFESLKDVKSLDSSDYLYPDESDWSSLASEIIQLVKPLFMNFTEAYYDYLSTNNVSLEDQLLYDNILTSIGQLFNETIEENALYDNTTEKNNTLENNDAYLERDILISIARFINETKEKSLSSDYSNRDNIIVESYYVSDWNNTEAEIIQQSTPLFINSTEAYYDYLSTNNVTLEDQLLYDDILASIAQLFNATIEEMALYGSDTEKNNTLGNNDAYLERDILISIARFINETKENDFSSDHSDSDYLIVEIDSDVSDWNNTESEIIQELKPLFMNFTEAYSDFLSTNNVSREDQLLYENILASIDQLFNETIEEMALYGNATEKNNTIGTDEGEDRYENNFLRL